MWLLRANIVWTEMKTNHVTYLHKTRDTAYKPNAGATLPVPDTNGLIIWTANNPGMLVVEESGPDVIEMSQHGKQALSLLVVPNLR